MIYLVINVTDNCEACKRAIAQVRTISETNEYISYNIKNINRTKENIVIAPAVFVNNKLYCYGEFENNSLLRYIAKQIS